jgi:hypothetical protein
MEERNNPDPIDTSHAWSGSWDRPLKIDEKSHDPLTIARMTDHNVRGHDDERQNESRADHVATLGEPEGAVEIEVIIDDFDTDDR